jgi:hypothetical protein
MKQRVFSFGLAVMLSCSLSAQDFISSTKQWNVMLNEWAGPSTEIFFIDGDSVVNSLNYNIIWVSYDSLLTWHYQGLLREVSNIVYYVPPDGNEGVLYDFNLEIGDNAYINNLFCSDIPIYVVDIDTVEYFGTARKRWLLGEPGYVQEAWIEGIGSMHGPLYTKFEYCIICPVWNLLCYHNNDTLEYIMNGYTDCYQTSVGIFEADKETGFAIYPNPIRKGNSIYITSNSVPNNIRVYNSSGVLMKSINSITDTKIKIETSDFKPGLYLIIITSNDGTVTTQKLLVE